jgi:MFS family permease
MRQSGFFKKSFPLLAFAFLFSFFSGLGQTYTLSLYVPSLAGAFNLTNTFFGSIYALATVAGGLSLPWLGGWFDKMNIRKYALFVLIGLILSLILLSLANHILVVIIAFFGLRLFGQGLMGHTSISAVARYFNEGRGKALGTATLGHPTAEAFMPLLLALLIGGLGWRGSLQLSALACILIMVPLTLILLKKSEARIRAYSIQKKDSTSITPALNFVKLATGRPFWIIVPLIFSVGFINTAVFFFQLQFGGERGWSAEWIAASVSAFAIANALGLTLAGPLVDRFSGKQLFRSYGFPYLVGLSIIILWNHPMAYPITLFFMGFSNGLGSTIKSAMMVEIYGVRIIGKVRSMFTMIIVFSTGLGPLLLGVFLDGGFSFRTGFIIALAAMILSVSNAWRKF